MSSSNATPDELAHSALHTPHSALPEEPGEMAALGALLLVAALVVAVFWGMRNTAGEGLYTTAQANSLLADGHYTDAAAMLERVLPAYNLPEMRLDLSYAYLARRDVKRAEGQARLAIDSAP